jgi:hypothetical protein
MLVSELEKKAEHKIKKHKTPNNTLIDTSSKAVDPLLFR